MENVAYVQKGDRMVAKDEFLQREIPCEIFNEATINKMEEMVVRFREKIPVFAEFCVNDFNFKFFLRHLTKDMLVEKLQTGQRLFYDGKWGYLFFDTKERNFGLLAIRFDEKMESFYLEDECCEGSSCNY